MTTREDIIVMTPEQKGRYLVSVLRTFPKKPAPGQRFKKLEANGASQSGGRRTRKTA
jgi:hypothetical protein